MMHGGSTTPQTNTGAPKGPLPGGPGGGRGPLGGGPMAMMQKGEKPRDFKGTLKKLVDYLGQYKLLILFIWLLAIASTVAMIVGPKMLGNATTKLFEGVLAQIAGTGGIDFNGAGADPVSGFGITELRPGLDHVGCGNEHHLPVPQRHCRKDQPDAAPIL
jgi:hypothetical protein